MTRKLLHKTLQTYLIFSLLILVVTAPVFYFFTEKLYLEDADETLILRRNEFVALTMPTMKESEISIWNKISKDGKIEKSVRQFKKDTLFYETHYDSLTTEHEPYHVLKSPVLIENQPYVLNLRVNLIETEDLIKSIVLLFAIIICLLLTGLYLITKRLSIKLWKPFYDTLHQIEQFEIDKHKVPHFTTSKIEEFHRLNEAISKLIEKNSVIFKGQREFVDNAAHELQTPLAIFQFTIDSLIQHPEVTQQQSELLSKLNDTASRLNRLNKNLLLLSKIDGNQYDAFEMVHLKPIFEKQLDFFIEQASAKNIVINVELEENCQVKSNTALLEILISNLFLNAVKHNVDNGSIQIVLTKDSFVFINTGMTKALEEDKLYKRFSKLNPSTHGNGLGLSIIKKITELNNWSICYSYKNDLHSFEIRF